MSRSKRARRALVLLSATAGLAASLFARTAQATTYTWDGDSSSSGNWNSSSNWSNGQPSSSISSILLFGASTIGTGGHTQTIANNTTSNNFVVGGLIFSDTNNSGLSVTGDSLQLQGTTGNNATITINTSSDVDLLSVSSIVLASSLSITGNGTSALTIYSPISGTNEAIIKTGSSTVILLGANTYTGGTVLNGGVIDFASGSLGSSGAISFTTSSTLQWATGNSQDISARLSAIGSGVTATFDTQGNGVTLVSVITGNGNIAKSGTGTLTLSNAGNNYAGTTILNAGTLDFANGALGAGNITFSASSALQWATGNTQDVSAQFSAIASGVTATLDTQTNSVTLANAITGSGAIAKAGLGTLSLTASESYSGGTTITAGALQIGTGGASGAISGNVADNASLIFNTSSSPTFTGIISGSGSLAQIGSGNLTLTGTNTYTGGTLISGGSLSITASVASAADDNLGSSISGVTLSSGGTLVANFSAAVNWNRTITLGTGGGVLDLVSGSLNVPVVTGGTGFTKTGGGDFILNGPDSFGTLTINQGRVFAFQTNSLGTSAVVVNNGGELHFAITGGFAPTNTMTFANGAVLSNRAAGTLTISTATAALPSSGLMIFNQDDQVSDPILVTGNYPTLTGNTTLQIGGQNTTVGSVTMAGNIGGSGELFKSSTGTLILTGANTFTSSEIDGGVLQVNTSSLIGNDVDDASLVFNQTGSGTFTGTITGTGSVSQIGAGTLTLSNASNNYSGATALSAGMLDFANGALGSGNITFSASSTLQWASGNTQDVSAQFSAIVSGVTATLDTQGNTVTLASTIGGSGAVVKAGSGTLILTASDTYSGGTTISGGALQIGNGGTSGSITGSVSDNGSLIFALSRATTLGAITGSGSLTQQGPGTLTLTSAETYGGGTTISGGALQLGNGGAAGSVTGNITDNGSLIFDLSGSVTLAGVVSGSGSVTQMGVGTYTLGSGNSYTGGTILDAGTLGFVNGGLSSTGNITFASTAALQWASGNTQDISAGLAAIGTGVTATFNTQGNSITLANAITGNGAVNKAGAATLTLTASESYSGGTTITAGGLQIGNGGTSGSINGNITDNGVFIYDQSDSNTVSGVISGSGSFIQLGSGTTTITSSDTYSGGTTISGGALQIGAGGTTGSIVGNVTDNASIIFDRSDTITVTGTIGGSGDLTQAGTGTLILTGSNSYVGGTTISVGVLQIGAGGANGPLNGNITDNSSLVFDLSSSVIFGGAITGSGSLTQAGAGTVTLNGSNNYSGGTTISLGALQVGAGGPAGSFNGDVTDNASLIFDRFDSYTFAGVISGSGSLTQEGLGSLTLASSNSYAGITTVSSGALLVSNNNELGSGSSAIQLTGGTLEIIGTTVSRNIALNAGGILVGTGTSQETGVITAANANNLGLQTGTSATDSFTIGNGANDLTGGGGSALITVNGSGTVILNQTSNYTGSWNVAGGTLNFAADADLGSAGSVTLSGGALQFANSFSSARTISLSSVGTIDTQANTDTLAGLITGSGTLSKVGSGSLSVTDATNNYTGGTTLNAGTLNFVSGGLGTSGSIGFTGNAALQWASGNTQDISSRLSAVPTGVTATLDTQANTVTLASALSGTGAYAKNGTGTLALTNASNSHSGGTVINNGTVIAGGPGTLGTGAVTLNGGSLTLQPAVGTTGTINALTDSGFGTDVVSTAFFQGQTGLDGSGNSFYTNFSTSTGAMPTGNSFTSASNANTHFTFQSYSGNNDLQLGNGATGSLTVSGAGKLQELAILWADSTAGTATVKLTFSNGAIDTVSSVSVPSYSNVSSGYAIHGLGTFNGSFTFNTGANDGLFEDDIAIPTIDQSLTLTNVSFTNNSNNDLNIMALSGQTTVPSTTTAFYNNNVNVTANSTINLPTLQNVTMGNLTIGSDTLSVTAGSSGANLTFGATSLSGNAVLSPASGATLVLGGAISGAFGITSAGAGTIIYGLGSSDTIANTYTGLTTITSGIVDLNKKAGVAAMAGPVSISGTGTLNVLAADEFGSGAGITVTIGTGSPGSGGTLTLNGQSQSLAGLNLTGSQVNGGGATLTISGDYNNDNFGSGNSFNAKPADISSTTINAAGGLTQVLTGTGISNGTGALATLTLAAGRAGVTDVAMFNITGPTSSSQPILRGSVEPLTSSITPLNPAFSIGVGGSAVESISLTSAVGTFNQTISVNNNFDNVAEQTLTVIGSFYNYASSTLASQSINFHNFRANSNTVGSFSISNISLGNLSYQDALVVTSSGTVGGVTSPGATTISAGSSGSLGYTASIATANVGAVSGLETLTLNSTPSASLSLDTKTLGTETVSISGDAYNYASTTLGSQTVALGNFRTGVSTLGSLSITNISLGNLSFQDSLVVSSVGSITGITLPTTASIAAGATSALSYTALITAANAGSVGGTSTLSFVSAPSATLSLDTKTLGSETVTITGAAYDFATYSLGATPVSFGTQRVSVGGTTAQTVSVTNTLLASSAAYQDSLSVNVTGGTNGQISSGSSFIAAAGSLGNALFTASLGTGGTLAGTESLSLTSTTTVASLTGESLGTVTVSTTGGVYNYADPTLAATSISLGNHHVTSSLATANLNVTNTLLSSGYQDELSVTGVSSNGLITVGSLATLNPSISGALGFTASLASAGSLAGTTTLSLQSVPTVSLSGRFTTQTVVTTGGVYNYATASITTPTVTLANAFVGATISVASIGLSNVSPTNGYSEYLDASIVGTSSGVTNGLTAGGSSVSLLSAGGSSSALSVGLNTSVAGNHAGTATLSLTSDGSTLDGLGLTTLTTQTVAVAGGTVYQHALLSLSAPTVTVRLTQGASGSTTYSLTNAAGTYVDTAAINSVTLSSGISDPPPSSLAAGASAIDTLTVTSSQAAPVPSGTITFQYGDSQTGLAGANVYSQFMTLSVNAIVDPIVEHVATTSGIDMSTRVLIGTASPTYLGSTGQYSIGVLNQANINNGSGAQEGTVAINVLPSGSAAMRDSILLFDFGSSYTSAEFSSLTSDLSAFGYTYSTDTNAGALGAYDHSSFQPTSYTYELSVTIAPDLVTANPSYVDFNFSQYGLTVDNFAAVPEPTSAAALMVGSLAILSRNRRRRISEKK